MGTAQLAGGLRKEGVGDRVFRDPVMDIIRTV